MALRARAATLTVLCLLLICILPSLSRAPISYAASLGTPPNKFIAGWAYSPPPIDGILSPGEWQNSTAIDFNITYSGNLVTPGILYVMNDARNLYLAVKINDSTFNPGDNLDLFFDNNNTGVLSNGDDALQFDVNALLTSHIGFFDEFRLTSDLPTARQEDRAVGGTTDGNGNATGDGSHNYFEISHPLSSGDTGHDFSLRPGDTVGLLVGYDDDGRIGSYWPSQSPGLPNYAERAQVTIATPPLSGTAPDFSLTADGANPEHQTVPVPLYEGFSQISVSGSTKTAQGLVVLSASSNSSGLIPWIPHPVVKLTCCPLYGYGENNTMLFYNATAIGIYNITVTGASGNLRHYANLYVNATHPTIGDFTVSASTNRLVVHPGTNTTTTVLLASHDNFTGNVYLSPLIICTGCRYPSSILSPLVFVAPETVHLPINGTGSSTLTIETPVLVAHESYILMIRASGGFLDRSYNITITVTLPDFTISATPANLTIQEGGSASATLTLTSLYGFTGTVSLTSPSSLAFFNPGSVILSSGGTRTSIVKIVTDSTTSPGNYTVKITGFRGSTSHNATIDVTVAASSTQRTPTSPTILGMDPPVFYGLTGAIAAATIVGLGLALGRRKPSSS